MKENVDRAQKRLGCVRKEIQRKENGSGQNNGDTVGLKKKCKREKSGLRRRKGLWTVSRKKNSKWNGLYPKKIR